MKQLDYVVYHHDPKYAILVLKESVGDRRAVISEFRPGVIDLVQLKSKQFDGVYVRCGREGRSYSSNEVIDPEEGVEIHTSISGRKAWHETQAAEALEMMYLANPKARVTPKALAHIERIAMAVTQFDTRGKSSEQIRGEVERLATELPKGHALKAVPKSYPDRSQAIMALTAIRQTIYKLTKGNTMAKGTKAVKPTEDDEVEAPTTKGKKAVTPEASTKGSTTKEAKAPGKAKVTKPAEEEEVPEPKAKGKAKAAKVEAEDEEEKPAKKAAKTSSANGAMDPEIKKAIAANKKAWAAKKEKVKFEGSFRTTDLVAKIKTPEELGIHGDSARHQLMEFMLENGKTKKGVTSEALDEAVDEGQWKQALVAAIKRGFVIPVA